MPARPPRDQVTTATRSPPALLEMLTLSGAPMPRTTSHSVCPSATDPRPCGGAPADPSVNALASAGLPDGVIPGQAPSALTRSSALTGSFGLKGGASIDTFLMKSRPGRENHSASFTALKSGSAPVQPEINGASAKSAQSRTQCRFSHRTIKQVPKSALKRLSDHHFAASAWLMKS